MLVDGKQIQQEIKEELRASILKATKIPSLGIVLAGDDPASEKFVSLKQKFGEEIGIDVWLKILPASSTTERVISTISNFDTDGIIVQLPLPAGIDESEVLHSIPKAKDVDVLGDSAFSDFVNQESPLIPPVAGAVLEVLDRHKVAYEEGMNVVVVGAGKLVGFPVSAVFHHRGINHEVITLETLNEKKYTLLAEADIIIIGAGDPHFLKKDMIKKGVVIIDAGTSEFGGKLCGDTHPDCAGVASLMTPVPGGIGPITVALLFKNLLTLCKK